MVAGSNNSQDSKKQLGDKKTKARDIKIKKIINEKVTIRENREEIYKQIKGELGFRNKLIIWTLQTIVAIVSMFLVFYFNPSFDFNLRIVILFIGTAWVVGSYIASYYLHKRDIKNYSRVICLNLAIDAAEELEKDNLIKGSFLARQVFRFLRQFVDKKVNLGTFKLKMDDLFFGKIEKIYENRSGIAMAITEDQKNKFANNLYLLAYSLFRKEEEIDYDAANRTMKWFIYKGKDFSAESTSLKKYAPFLEKNSEKLLGIAYTILLFLLWYFFGWQPPT